MPGLSADELLIFYGEDSAECEAFVRSIRRYAFQQDKDGDNRWTARLAATCFDGEALRWHATLDEEICDDWRLLQQALFAKYPRVESSGPCPPTDLPTIPIPAAAAPAPKLSTLSMSSPLSRIGRLQVKNSLSGSRRGYIGRKLADEGFIILSAPHDASAALLVEVIPSMFGGDLCRLRLILMDCFISAGYLGVIWDREGAPGLFSWALATLVAVEEIGLETSWDPPSNVTRRVHSHIWKIRGDVVEATLPDMSRMPATFRVHPPIPCITAGPSLYAGGVGDQVRIIFEEA